MDKADKLVEQGVIKFQGFVNNVGDYICIMDVFAYPSNYEGLGSVLLDVMEQGVPVVASAVDGIPDIVKHKETGLLIKRGDSRALAESILSIRESVTLRQNLVNQAHSMARLHSPEKMAEKYLEIYREVCEQERI